MLSAWDSHWCRKGSALQISPLVKVPSPKRCNSSGTKRRWLESGAFHHDNVFVLEVKLCFVMREESSLLKKNLRHLGMQNWIYTPTYRGFDTFYGYYTGSVGYQSKRGVGGFFDLHDQERLVSNPTEVSSGTHLTLLLQDKVEGIIAQHAAASSSTGQPLFLLYAPQSGTSRQKELHSVHKGPTRLAI